MHPRNPDSDFELTLTSKPVENKMEYTMTRYHTSDYNPASRTSALLGKAWGGLALMALACVLLPLSGSAAQSLYWVGPGGGTLSGAWDDTSSFWSQNATVSSLQSWTDSKNAIFAANGSPSGAYTLTLAAPRAAGNLTFNTGPATITGSVLTLDGTGAITVNSGLKATISSSLGGSVGVTKQGSGSELVLQGANTFTGNLTATAGTLTLDNNQAASTGSIVLNPTAAVVLHSSQSLTTLTNNVTLSGTTSTIDVVADSGKTLVLSGVISGPHPLNVSGQGTVRLEGSGANTFAGALVVANGTLVVGKNRALGDSVTGPVINSGATLAIAGGFEYTTGPGANSIKVNGAGFSGGAALQNLSGDNIYDGTLVLGNSSAVDVAASTSLTLNGPVTGSFDLTKTGNGILDLIGGPNTYGNTTVSAGSLGVWGSSVAGTGLVTVSSGAMLEGDGSVPGGVNLSGTISPGASPDTLNSGAQTWNSGATYLWEINDTAGAQGTDPGWDWLNISGALTINASSASPIVLSINSLEPTGNTPGDAANFNNASEYAWTIATATGGIIGFDASKFSLNAGGFLNDVGNGAFVLVQSGNSL